MNTARLFGASQRARLVALVIVLIAPCWVGPAAGNNAHPRQDVAPPLLFAGTTSQGVGVSLDGGVTWAMSAEGLVTTRRPSNPTFPREPTPPALAIDPSDASRLYFATESRLFVSGDGGETWRAAFEDVAANPTNSALDISAITIDAARPQTIFAGFGGRLHRSVDRGVTWVAVGADVPDGGLRNAVALDPSVDGGLFAASRTQVFHSTDRGETWQPVGAPPLPAMEPLITSLLVAAGPPATLFARTSGGTYASDDGGANWRRVRADPPNAPLWSIAIDPVTSNLVYALAGPTAEASERSNRLLVSADRGRTWSQVGDPFRDDGYASLTIAAGSPRTFYAVGHDGSRLQPAVLRHVEGDTSWGVVLPLGEVVRTMGRILWELAPVVVGPQGNIYIGLTEGILSSADGGVTWRTVLAFPRTPPVEELVAAPSDPDVLYARIGDSGGGDLFASTDGGRSWRLISPPWEDTWDGFRRNLGPIAVAPSNSRIVYAGAEGSRPHVFRSTDGGGTWTSVLLPVGTSGPVTPAVLSLAVDSHDPNIIFAGAMAANTGFSAMYRSVDGGVSWGEVAQTIASVIAVHPETSSVVYAAGRSTSRNFMRSLDGGTTWEPLPFPISFAGTFRSLVIDPRDSAIVFAGVEAGFNGVTSDTGGVFRSTDGGQSWTAMNDGLETIYFRGNYVALRSLVLDPNAPDHLYASTTTGIYETMDGAALWVKVSELSGTLAIAARR